MNASDLDDVVREIAAKHGVALSPDDPIMIVFTAMKLFLEKHREEQDGWGQAHAQQLEDVSRRFRDASQETAEKSLNAAVVAARRELNHLLAEGRKEILEQEKRSWSKVQEQAERAVKGLWVAAGILCAAALVLVGCAVFLL